MPSILLSALTLALLLPAMYRRHRRRRGGEPATSARGGHLAVFAVSSLLVVGAISGAAFADNGPRFSLIIQPA